ncbi:MAG: ABC transporter permease [Thiocapsa sp.]|jgi:ABC-2 type transport system permease protein|nr:ABC transporter permease [Thiocapsa sp.]MCG6897871.1 ABC transporter permease [Thiocapsa sp.]
MLQHILALALKELLALLRDPRSRFVLIGPPIAQLLVFGFAATFDLNQAPLAVYDRDGGAPARELIARFEGSRNFRVVRRIADDREVTPMIDGREALLVLHIDPRFTADLLRGAGGRVQVILDGRNSNTAATALNYVRQILIDFNQTWTERLGRPGVPVSLSIRPWYNANLESRWFIVPGIVGLLTLVVTLVVTSLSVAREREAGTFDQLLVTPLRPVEILIGKSTPGLLIGLLQGSLIVFLVVFAFGVPLRGSLGALYLGMGLFLLSAVGVGLMISSLSVTQQQGLLGAFLFLVPSVILSGFATPIANMPEVVQLLTYIDPLRYFLIVLRGVFLEGDSYALLVDQYWPMAVIGLSSLTAAGWLFRHRMY